MVNYLVPINGYTPADCALAGPTRGIRHAFGRDCDLSLLHCVDPVDGMLIDNYVWFSTLMFVLQPFVDPGHPLHDIFPPRVWAIRIPVILTLLGSAVVGTFIGIVMINSNKKKAAKAKAAAKKKT